MFCLEHFNQNHFSINQKVGLYDYIITLNVLVDYILTSLFQGVLPLGYYYNMFHYHKLTGIYDWIKFKLVLDPTITIQSSLELCTTTFREGS